MCKIRKQDNMFSTSLFQRDSHLDEYASFEKETARADVKMGGAYDFEGFTASTLRSKGCVAGVGVDDV